MTDRQAFYNALLRASFPEFLHRCFLAVSPGDVFLDNWHLKAISWQLDRIGCGETNRLIVTVPPRSLKSIAISVAWVAWRLGHDPSLRFVCVSYSAELALKHARDCRAIMNLPFYRRAFPRTVLSRERSAEHDFTTTSRGGRFSTSVGGTMTGRGGDVIIIDDPIKPEDAASDAVRNGVNGWFGSTLSSRLNSKASGSIVLIMQRLHEADLAGHLLEAGGWDHLNLPALAEVDEDIPLGGGRVYHRPAGEPLHAARESRAVLQELQRAMGSAAFSAQYQQAPVPPAGLMVDRSWFKRYVDPPDHRPGDRIVQSWDCASKDGVLSDWSVCITALIRRRQVYVLDVFRDRLKFPDLHRQAIALARRHRATTILIEDAASGTQLIQQLWGNQPHGVPRPLARRPKGDKATRMSGASQRIEAGELLLPANAPWLAEFEREVLAFPSGRHDDQVDALSQLLNWDAARTRFLVPAAPELIRLED